MRISELPDFLKDSLSCARFILFNNPGTEEQYRHSFGGSGFFVTFNKTIYFITANHCVEARSHDDLYVPADQTLKDRTVVDFDFTFRSKCDDGDNTDQNDLRIYRTNLAEMPGSTRAKLIPFNLQRTLATSNCIGLEAVVLGYPFSYRSIDYERMTISGSPRVFYGKVLGPDHSQRNIFIVTREIDGPVIDDPNGLSGSPVFVIRPWMIQPQLYLAGMVLRGGTGVSKIDGIDCSTLRVISSNVIVGALKRLESSVLEANNKGLARPP
jgi:hypothetical protein